MPARNVIRFLVGDSYYHVYNRGVEKRAIFQDKQDYSVFQSYLKHYLSDPAAATRLPEKPGLKPETDPAGLKKDPRRKNFNAEIQLVAYCLMPNHFHLLIRQKNERSITGFMQSLGITYTMYFNHKYDRVGALFQGVYKAVLVESDEQLLTLSSYIHQQALEVSETGLEEKQPSSFAVYTGKRQTGWVHPADILEYFDGSREELSYAQFVRERVDQKVEADRLEKKLRLE